MIGLCSKILRGASYIVAIAFLLLQSAGAPKEDTKLNKKGKKGKDGGKSGGKSQQAGKPQQQQKGPTKARPTSGRITAESIVQEMPVVTGEEAVVIGEIYLPTYYLL